MKSSAPTEEPVVAPPPPDEQRETLLVEYEAAQSSAQHHDTLLWSATYTIWSGNLVLLAGVFVGLSYPRLWLLLAFACLLGIVLVASVERFARDFRSIKNQKYGRCKDIERQLGMRQHLDARTRVGVQARIYTTINGALIVAWVFALTLALDLRALVVPIPAATTNSSPQSVPAPQVLIPLLAVFVGGLVTYVVHAGITKLKADFERRDVLRRLTAELEVLLDAAARVVAAMEARTAKEPSEYYTRARWNDDPTVKWTVTAFEAFNRTFTTQQAWIAVVSPATRRSLIDLHLQFHRALALLEGKEVDLKKAEGVAPRDVHSSLHRIVTTSTLSDEIGDLLKQQMLGLTVLLRNLVRTLKDEEAALEANIVGE